MNFKTSCLIFIEKNLDVNVVLIFDQMNIFVLEYPYEVINKSSLLVVKYFVDRTHLSELATNTTYYCYQIDIIGYIYLSKF